MIDAPSDFSASGAGESLSRLAIAFTATPFFGPSLEARSNNTVSTPALVKCAAICAPITPAPNTAALRMFSFSGIESNPWIKNGTRETGRGRRERRLPSPVSRFFQPRRREADQVFGRAFAELAFGLTAAALNHAEVRHCVSEGAGDDVQPPIQ